MHFLCSLVFLQFYSFFKMFLLVSYIFYLYKIIPSHEGGFLAIRQDFWQKDRNCCNKKILENFFVQFLVLYHQTNLTDPVHHTSLDISHTRECQAWSITWHIFATYLHFKRKTKQKRICMLWSSIYFDQS